MKCQVCNKRAYSEYCVAHKPRKPIKVNKPLPRPARKIKQQGKHALLWRKTRIDWIKRNYAEYWICYLCGKRLENDSLTLDHVIPRSRAPELRYVLDNLKPACYSCNMEKGSRVV